MQSQNTPSCPPAGGPLQVGGIALRNNVCLAPMSGLSDAPLRRMVEDFGVGLTFSEMVASGELSVGSDDAVRRLRKTRHNLPLAVQLSGREAETMAEAAKIAEGAGADIIDLNFGCPSRRVTGGYSGASLMREPDRARRLIDSVVEAVDVPVTVKMRLGWDEASLNAPLIASSAEQSGAKMVSVHARTRNQFYKGRADWEFVRRVRDEITIPLLVNGDITSLDDARSALQLSGACGVMIGRGAIGRPWFPGQLARALRGGKPFADPPLDEQRRVVKEHYRDILNHYGEYTGIRCARKHLAAYIETASRGKNVDIAHWRGRICRSERPDDVLARIDGFFDFIQMEQAA